MRPAIDRNELNFIKEVFKSKILTEGNFARKFELEIARYVHARYAVATTSATTALHTCLETVRVRGKKVMVSDFTFPASVQAIILAGGKPLLVDVDRHTMNVNRNIIENAIDDETGFVVPVSLFGNPLEHDFYKLRKQGIMIVEDAATNLGTKIGDKFVGSFADLTCFSFHPRKIITTGEGGMITTNNKSLAYRCKTYKQFGKTNDDFVYMGTNYKLSDILAAVGLSQLKKIEKIIKKRILMAKIYDELLSKVNFITPQEHTPNSRHTYQSYTCYITQPNLRNKIRKILSMKNVETQIGTYALHCLPAFRNCMKKGSLKNSEFLYKNSISLPLHEELTTENQEFICKTIKGVI